MKGIIRAIKEFFLRFVTDQAVAWTAVKGMIYFALTMILPVVLYNVAMTLLSEYLTWVAGKMSGMDTSGLSLSVIQLSGMGAWLAIQLRLPESFALVLSAVKIRLILNTLPGVK